MAAPPTAAEIAEAVATAIAGALPAPPAPAATNYALHPALASNAVIDYSTTAGKKLYKQATTGTTTKCD